jgi:hypothetical protein
VGRLRPGPLARHPERHLRAGEPSEILKYIEKNNKK